MRHIPEAEIHPYLDQALSRSQCVEIERHLANCPRCQALRDEIAGVRDRTTDLLARIGSGPVITPPFASLQFKAQGRIRRRRRWLVAGAAAAGLAATLLITTAGPRLAAPVGTSPLVSVAATSEPAPIASHLDERPAPDLPRPGEVAQHSSRPAAEIPSLAGRSRLVRLARPAETAGALRFARLDEVDASNLPASTEAPEDPTWASWSEAEVASQPAGTDPGLSGIWLTVTDETDPLPPPADLPRIPGLPVVRVRIQPGDSGAAVTAVDQLLQSGELVRVVSGDRKSVV